MKLSEHFTLEELTFSETGTRHNIPNVPDEEQKNNLKWLTSFVLEPLRQQLARPVIVVSGFRNKQINKLVKGAKNSQHTLGQAADIKVPGMPLKQVFDFIQRNIPFDQLIYEFDSWIHISYAKHSNRSEVLIATKENGKTVYREAA